MQNKESNILVIKTAKSESGRIFFIKFLSFENGCFIAIVETSDRIGSISVSISSSNKVNTAKVIPSKFDSIFISTISERISLVINGICILSLHNTKQLNLDDMKAIMEEIMNLLDEKYNESDYKKGEKADYR
ncbi:MAG TPA: hypothetical protein VE572_03485 [Nitrososphaeraceae archaeon]|jgi:hypothetical protein|nr:hypothetical protein [Nitrososphaeraceae archaeon]